MRDRPSQDGLALDDVAASHAVAEELLRHAWLSASVDRDGLEAAIRSALRAPGAAESSVETTDPFGAILGESAALRAIIELARRAAWSRAAVLITGETGTGKDLLARAIHLASPRARGPFVSVTPAALASTLLESELFGHERGAFTGAHSLRRGRFEQAHHGTLFLDEIAEISALTQIKLLRVLQDHAFERVGGNQRIEVDVRLIAATNRDLSREISAGRFRMDLLYRLKVVQLELPPLRDRGDDVLLLAERILARQAAANGKLIRGFSDAARRRLRAQAWPGNVRELENSIERAVVLCNDPVIGPEHLPETAAPALPRDGTPTLAELERVAIVEALEASNWSTARAAERLGISVRTVQYRVSSYGLAARIQSRARLRKDERP